MQQKARWVEPAAVSGYRYGTRLFTESEACPEFGCNGCGKSPRYVLGFSFRGISGAFFAWIAHQTLTVRRGVHESGLTELASSRAAWRAASPTFKRGAGHRAPP